MQLKQSAIATNNFDEEVDYFHEDYEVEVMIIKKVDQCNKVEDPKGQWNSIRMLLKEDGMGFSFHITTIYKDSNIKMHYINHLSQFIV